MSFIDEEKIKRVLEENAQVSSGTVAKIIEKSKGLKGLNDKEVASLLHCDDQELIKKMFKAARYIKEEIYGNRLVLFAPLYLSNICVNNCLYCGFRRDNKDLTRIKLGMDEIEKEVKVLLNEGHKRLLLVASEDLQNADIDYLINSIKRIYTVKEKNGEIRRVNVNVAPLSVEEFKKLKEAGIGTYQCFQETYHKETYATMHGSGPKSDYDNRLYVMDRAQEAGVDDVGIGVLFGLYNYKFEVLALLEHCLYLEQKFGVGPHTISVPRIETALNAPVALDVPCPVSDDDFKKIIAIIRMAVPYTGMILSTRETAQFRNSVIELGISQISAGSRTNPGAYVEKKKHFPESEQFNVGDTRSQAQIVNDVLDKGLLPSFCTACYRVGRTGEEFMDLAKPGEIKNFCLPNCVLTFKEYLLDYGDSKIVEKGTKVINSEILKIPDLSIREKTLEKLKELENGKRDLYF